MNPDTIAIEPYSYGPRGEATLFQVGSFSGTPFGNVTFAASIQTSEMVELDSRMINTTPEEFATWVDDEVFFKFLATKAGFTPV